MGKSSNAFLAYRMGELISISTRLQNSSGFFFFARGSLNIRKPARGDDLNLLKDTRYRLVVCTVRSSLV